MNPAASNYSMPNRVLKLDARDNVLIALADLRKGEQIPFDSQTYTLESDVAAKHKFATEDLSHWRKRADVRSDCGESG